MGTLNNALYGTSFSPNYLVPTFYNPNINYIPSTTLYDTSSVSGINLWCAKENTESTVLKINIKKKPIKLNFNL